MPTLARRLLAGVAGLAVAAHHVGPHYYGKLPAGLRVIRSSYDRIWICGRTLVKGPSDLPAVHKIQDGYKLIPLKAFERAGLSYSNPRPKRIITTHSDASVPTGLKFFDALGTAMAQNPPPSRDAKILRELKTVGIGPGLYPSTEHLPAQVIAGLQAAAATGSAKVSAIRAGIVLAYASKHHGWYVARCDIGNFGTDYGLRAVVAVYGIAANISAEALYPVGSFDNTGQLLNGAHKLCDPHPRPRTAPVHAYWSFTTYNRNRYLVANPIGRYAINQFTPGVKHNTDRSLDIYVQSTSPAGHESNWLPSPPSGQFEIVLRMYWPKNSVVSGTFNYPPITRVG